MIHANFGLASLKSLPRKKTRSPGCRRGPRFSLPPYPPRHRSWPLCTNSGDQSAAVAAVLLSASPPQWQPPSPRRRGRGGGGDGGCGSAALCRGTALTGAVSATRPRRRRRAVSTGGGSPGRLQAAPPRRCRCRCRRCSPASVPMAGAPQHFFVLPRQRPAAAAVRLPSDTPACPRRRTMQFDVVGCGGRGAGVRRQRRRGGRRSALPVWAAGVPFMTDRSAAFFVSARRQAG